MFKSALFYRLPMNRLTCYILRCLLLQIYNSSSIRGAVVARLCGILMPSPIYLASNEALLVFSSDHSLQYKGFRLEYTATLPGSRPTAGIYRPSYMQERHMKAIVRSVWRLCDFGIKRRGRSELYYYYYYYYYYRFFGLLQHKLFLTKTYVLNTFVATRDYQCVEGRSLIKQV